MRVRLFFDFMALPLLPIAFKMRKLHVLQVGWVPSHGYRNDMVHRRTHRRWIFYGEIHRLPTDRTDGLGGKDYFPVPVILGTVFSVMVWSVSFWFHNHPLGKQNRTPKRPACRKENKIEGLMSNLPDTIIPHIELSFIDFFACINVIQVKPGEFS